MMPPRSATFVPLAALAPVVLSAALGLTPQRASAQVLEKCGNFFATADLQCKLEPPGVTCEQRCSAPTVRVTCATSLALECKEECVPVIVETEVQVCADECVPKCELNPGKFACSASCGVDCGVGCTARCAAALDRSRCEASCRATCSLSCGAECQVVAPSASCRDICQPVCRGIKKAEVTTECQVRCQEKKFTTCEEHEVQDCRTQCTAKEGALFCDGQFVGLQNTVDQCIDALKNLNIIVDAGFHLDISSGGCALAAGETAPTWVGLLLLAWILTRARHRRSR